MHSYCINLDRRTDRWANVCQRFRDAWPYAMPVRVSAVDGTTLSDADWDKIASHWGAKGDWGCAQSHINVLRQIAQLSDPAWVMEDDVCFCPDFKLRLAEFLNAVPTDWDALWLGGTFMRGTTNHYPTHRRVRGVVRTHCYCVRPAFAKIMADTLANPPRGKGYMDNKFAQWQVEEGHAYKIYAPPLFIAGQCDPISDTVWARRGTRSYFYNPADEYDVFPEKEPLCVL